MEKMHVCVSGNTQHTRCIDAYMHYVTAKMLKTLIKYMVINPVLGFETFYRWNSDILYSNYYLIITNKNEFNYLFTLYFLNIITTLKNKLTLIDKRKNVSRNLQDVSIMWLDLYTSSSRVHIWEPCNVCCQTSKHKQHLKVLIHSSVHCYTLLNIDVFLICCKKWSKEC